MAITVTLPDGKTLELADGASGADAAAAIGPGLARAALAVLVDGELRDLTRPLPDGARISLVTERDREQAARPDPPRHGPCAGRVRPRALSGS